MVSMNAGGGSKLSAITRFLKSDGNSKLLYYIMDGWSGPPAGKSSKKWKQNKIHGRWHQDILPLNSPARSSILFFCFVFLMCFPSESRGIRVGNIVCKVSSKSNFIVPSYGQKQQG